jgi:hypothetical protein
MDLRNAWDAADPALWRRAATDLRALLALEGSATQGREQLAGLLGYAGVSKVDALAGQGRRLRADAAAGEVEAVERLERAEALCRIVTEAN